MWRWVLTTAFIFTFCVGLGFLTIPFSIYHPGFWPCVFATILVWGYLLVTGFYYLEATLASPKGSNIYSISKRYIGNIGKWLATIVFLVINIVYLVLYFHIANIYILEFFGIKSSFFEFFVIFFYVFLFCLVLFFGVRFALVINLFLAVVLLILSTFAVNSGFGLIILKPTSKTSWVLVFLILPYLYNSLFHQTLIPTIADFLNRQRKAILSSLITGVSLGAIFFIVWLWLITSLSIEMPSEKFIEVNPSYLHFERLSYDTLSVLPNIGKWVAPIFYFGVVTSILGIGLVLVDFISDACGIVYESRSGIKRLWVCLLVSISALVLFFISPHHTLFFIILIGELGTIFMGAIMPIWWVFALRSDPLNTTKPVVFGGNVFLTVCGLIAILMFYLVGLEFFFQ